MGRTHALSGLAAALAAASAAGPWVALSPGQVAAAAVLAT